MKASRIFVGIDGATLQLSSGAKAVAVYPVQKGEKESYMLLENGRMATLKGSRINGVGVPRFLADNGFALAKPNDPQAAKLADMLDVREGTKLVEAACGDKAQAIQQSMAGKVCSFVPFDESKPIKQVTVKEKCNSITVLFDLQNCFSAAMVRTDAADNPFGADLSLASGWLVGPEVDATKLPRNSEYGGVVERAVFTICNTGMATPVRANLVMPDDAAADEPFPRGMLEMELSNGDRVHVGVNAGDELEVDYLRGGAVLYSRDGMSELRLGDVIGSIAAVIVRVNEMDAAASKKSLKKAA